MEYLNKIRSAVSTVTATVNSALPGNPVTREYEAIEHVASAGPGLSWKIYTGRKKSTKQSCAVWVFEKRDIERWPKREKELFTEILKKGVSQLTKLRHPRMLIVEHPMEESRESLAFCTEPVFSSLANMLGRVDNMPSIIPPHLSQLSLDDIEIRHGLFQLSEALAFLHQDAKILHRNICPESVVVNEKGSWKLAGFDFCVSSTGGFGQPASYPLIEWESDLMPCIQPSLDYLGPEMVVGGRCDTAADIFSLGVLAYAAFSKGRTPMDNGNSLNTFRKNAKELKSLPPSLLRSVPDEFREDVKMCLNFTPDLRPDATQFSKVAYFDQPMVKTLTYLESLMQMDNTQKSQFFKGLPNILGRFPKRALLQKILPFLTSEFTTPELVPFILPNIFLISEQATDSEFANTIFPLLIPVFKLQKPFQISLMLLQNIELLLSKTPDSEVKTHLLPLIYNALDSDTAKIQELCLSVVPRIAKLVDRHSMKTYLLPQLLKMGEGASVLSVKVNSLLCIGRLLECLEPWMVHEQVLPMLPKTNSKEPGVLMAVLGIYRLAYSSTKLGIPKEALAKHCIPFLVSASVESSLNVKQYDQFVTLIHEMLKKVEEEHRARLQQLSAFQEEQRAGVPDFNQVLDSTSKQHIPKELQGLDAIGQLQQNGTQQTSNSKVGKGPLSLEEKKRLAAEQEQNVRLRAQPKLQPTLPKGSHTTPSLTSPSSSGPATNSAFAKSVQNNPVDLTSSLLQSPPQPAHQMGNSGSVGGWSQQPSPQFSASNTQSSNFGGGGLLQPSGSSFTDFTSSQRPMAPGNGGANLNLSGGNLSGSGGFARFPAPPPGPGSLTRAPNPMGGMTSGGAGGYAGSFGGRGNVDMSAFDSLLSFDKGKQTPHSTPRPTTNRFPPPPMGGSQQSRAQPNATRDPFDDLFK